MLCPVATTVSKILFELRYHVYLWSCLPLLVFISSFQEEGKGFHTRGILSHCAGSRGDANGICGIRRRSAPLSLPQWIRS